MPVILFEIKQHILCCCRAESLAFNIAACVFRNDKRRMKKCVFTSAGIKVGKKSPHLCCRGICLPQASFAGTCSGVPNSTASVGVT